MLVGNDFRQETGDLGLPDPKALDEIDLRLHGALVKTAARNVMRHGGGTRIELSMVTLDEVAHAISDFEDEARALEDAADPFLEFEEN